MIELVPSLTRGLVERPVFEPRPNPVAIIHEVAKRWGVNPDDLRGPSRVSNIAHARQEAMWALRQAKRANGDNWFSLPRIGRMLDRDHSTVIHGLRVHAERLGRA